jgi:hypothetical protein
VEGNCRLEEIWLLSNSILSHFRSGPHRRVTIANNRKEAATNIHFMAAKFPVIDEDLLALATNSQNPANPPPNLCRLITNVSECRWTSKLTGNHQSAVIQTVTGTTAEEINGTSAMPQFALRHWGQPGPSVWEDVCGPQLGLATKTMTAAPLKFQGGASFQQPSHRLSALSGVGPGGILNDAVNCDCSSLAKSAFRRSAYSNPTAIQGRKLLDRQLQNGIGENEADLADDSYRKILPPTIQNGSIHIHIIDIDTSPSGSSQRALFDNSGGVRNGGAPNTTKTARCTTCGPDMLLPPSSKRSTEPVEAPNCAAMLLSRRRRALNYFLGNMMRLLDYNKKSTQCCPGCGTDMDSVNRLSATNAIDIYPPNCNMISITKVNVVTSFFL